MTPSNRKILFICFGWISFILGTVGTVVPLLPTTPLYILAAYFFSKGSDRLHQWMRSRPVFGPIIIEWETHSVIRPRAKWMSTLGIVVVFTISLAVTNVHWIVKILLVGIAIWVLRFIWTKPSAPPSS